MRGYYLPIIAAFVTLSLSARPGLAVDFAGGTGEPNDPYQIATASQLVSIGSDPNLLDKHYILVNDIDLDPNLPGGRVFDDSLIGPIPWYCDNQTCHGFTGVFHGDSHVIHNLTIDIAAWDSFGGAGLFGLIGRGGRVEALWLKSVNVRGHYSVGALAQENRGTIARCHVAGLVKGRKDVGGLVGRNGVSEAWKDPGVREFLSSPVVDSLIFACSADVEVDRRVDFGIGWSDQGTYVGGLVGTNAGIVYACRCRGGVKGEEYVGGLVGYNDRGWIRSSYTESRVYSPYYAGGLAGGSQAGILFCYAVGPVSTSSWQRPMGICSEGYRIPPYLCYWDAQTTGCAESLGGTPKTISQMRSRDTFRGWGYDGQWVLADGQDYPRLVWEGTEGEPIVDDPGVYSVGAGTAEDPYEVSTVEQFLALGYSWPLFDRHFILTEDLDLSKVDPEDAASIGTRAIPFLGSFEGNDHVVTGLRIRRQCEGLVGLFGYVGRSGAVKNVEIFGAEVRGWRDVGVLAGYSEGTIANCRTDGYAYGEESVGGAIGRNWGTVAACGAHGQVISLSEAGGFAGRNHGTIDSSHSAVMVTSLGGSAGGFVSGNSGTISSCYSDSIVVSDSCAGGFAAGNGQGKSEIRDCYSLGSVEGIGGAGGFLYANVATVRRCYSACTVRSKAAPGGFLGVWNPAADGGMADIESCYWDADASGVETSPACTGLTAEQMRQQTSFAGWDFGNVWTICEGRGYPRLRWEGAACEP